MKKTIFLFFIFFSFPTLALCPRGDSLYEKNELGMALSMYEGCAIEGDIKSQFHAGNFYYLGKGIPKSPRGAFEYYRMAAESGYAPAQVKLALLFWRGEGVSLDLVQALKWLILAADGKDRKWFYPAMENGLAAENEDPKAKEYMTKLLGLVTPAQKEEAVKLASEVKFSLLKKKAKQVLTPAEYENFLATVEKNSQDRRKIDTLILDLYKTYLSRKKNNE